jgi:hypothetical protein
MSSDTIQVTLTRTQATILRRLLMDASAENVQIANVERSKGDTSWFKASAELYFKRATTARMIGTRLGKAAKDKRRKYLNLSTEVFPVSQ